MNQNEKKILRFTASSHTLVHLYEGALPPLIPLLLTEFSTDYFHLGLVVTVFSYAFGLAALPAGYISDKAGPKRLVTIFLFGAGILSVFAWPVNSLLAFSVLLALIGLFCSLYHPAANTLISNSFQQKGKAFALNGIAGSFGIAITPVISAWLGAMLGWKVPYIAFGLLGIAVACFSLALQIQPTQSMSVDGEEDEKQQKNQISYLNLVLFYLTAVLLGITYRGTMTFLPAYMGQKVQLSFIQLDAVTIGGAIATIALLFGGIGQYTSGHLVDRYKPEKIYFWVMIIGTVWVFFMAKSSNLLLVISAILFAMFYFATQPVQNYLITNFLPKHRRGLGFGLYFFLAFSVGSTAAAISGYLADRFGLTSVFYSMGGCLLISTCLAGVLLFRTRTAPSD